MTDIQPGERVKDVRLTIDLLSVDLIDGRTICVPLAWYPRLLHATEEQRANWQVSGGGYGIHWPDIDEDLSTADMLRGTPTSRRASGGKHQSFLNTARSLDLEGPPDWSANLDKYLYGFDEPKDEGLQA